MAVRTDVLVHQSITLAAAAFATVQTVPAGEVWLVRTITAFNRTGASSTLIVGSLRSGLVARWLQAVVPNITPSPRDGVFYVAEAGDQIQALSTVAGNIDVFLYGSRLVV